MKLKSSPCLKRHFNDGRAHQCGVARGLSGWDDWDFSPHFQFEGTSLFTPALEIPSSQHSHDFLESLLTPTQVPQEPGPCPGIIPCCFPAAPATSSPPFSWWVPSGAGTRERTARPCVPELSSGDSAVRGWQPCCAARVTALLCTPTRAKAQTCTSGCGRHGNGAWTALPKLWKSSKGSGSIPQTSSV